MLRRPALVVVPLLLVAAGMGAYVATTGDAEPEPTSQATTAQVPRSSQEENPAPGVIWYADGQLHLDHAVLAVEGSAT